MLASLLEHARQVRRLIAVLVVILPVAGASSCGSGSDADDEALAEGYIGSINIFNPTDYIESRAALRAEAEEEVQRCMTEQGFDYEIGSSYSLEQNDPMAAALLSGISDEDFARTWGFGVGNYQGREDSAAELESDPSETTASTGTSIDLSDPETAAYFRALDGSSPANPGCVWPAYEEFRSLDANYSDSIEDVLAMQEAFAISPEVIDYYQDWSKCMLDKGYSYTSPLEAKLLHLNSRDIPFEEEQDAAAATVDCGGSVIQVLPEDLLSRWAEFIEKTASTGTTVLRFAR